MEKAARQHRGPLGAGGHGGEGPAGGQEEGLALFLYVCVVVYLFCGVWGVGLVGLVSFGLSWCIGLGWDRSGGWC